MYVHMQNAKHVVLRFAASKTQHNMYKQQHVYNMFTTFLQQICHVYNMFTTCLYAVLFDQM